MLTGEILNTKYRATKFIAMFNTGYEKKCIPLHESLYETLEFYARDVEL